MEMSEGKRGVKSRGRRSGWMVGEDNGLDWVNCEATMKELEGESRG